MAATQTLWLALKIVVHLLAMLLNAQSYTKVLILSAVWLLQGLLTGMLLERDAMCQLLNKHGYMLS